MSIQLVHKLVRLTPYPILPGWYHWINRTILKYSVGLSIGQADSTFNIVWVILRIGWIVMEYSLSVSICQVSNLSDIVSGPIGLAGY